MPHDYFTSNKARQYIIKGVVRKKKRPMEGTEQTPDIIGIYTSDIPLLRQQMITEKQKK